jgi:hypothetical protein
MARNQTERNVRRDTPLREGDRPVRLESTRRFYNSRGDDSAVRSARALTDALGIGLEFYGEHLERKNEEGAKQAVFDAATGVRQVAQNKGYEETMQRIEAQSDLALMNKELSGVLTEAGWEDLPEDEVQGIIDEYYKGQLQGVNGESVYGSLIAEGALAANAELLNVYRVNTLEKVNEEKRTMLYNSATSMIELDPEDGIANFDYGQFMKDTATMMPGPGGRDNFVGILATIAEDMAAPELLENIPETFPNGEATGINDPKFRRDVLNPAIARAEKAQRDNQAEADREYLEKTAGARAATRSQHANRAALGDGSVIAEVLAGSAERADGLPPLYTEAQAESMLNQVWRGQANAGIATANASLFRAGEYFGGTQKEYDDAAQAFAQQESARIAEEEGLEGPELNAAVAESVLERSLTHERLPSFITNRMKATTNNPERLAEAADLYRLVEENKPGLADRSLNDIEAARLRSYEAYMVETGGDTERTIDLMNSADPTLLDGKSKYITETATEIVNDLAADAVAFWGSAPVSQRDIRRAEKLVRIQLEQGTPEDLIPELVTEAFQKRNTRIDGTLYPADFGWEGDGEAALGWFLNGGSGDYWPEDANLVAQPHPTERGVILVRDENSGLLHRAPYSVKEIQKGFRDYLHDMTIQSAESNLNPTSGAYAEAESRAANRMFTDYRSYLEPGMRSNALSPLDRFRQLSPEDREKAIRAEYATAQ